MKPDALQVLYEDNHLLVVNKPAGMVSMGPAKEGPSLLEAAKAYVKQKYNKPGNVYLGLVSRLDAPVTGVMLLARTSKAAARLTAQFRDRTVEKSYLALVEGRVPPAGRCRDWLAKDERHRRMHRVAADHAGAQEALLEYERVRIIGGNSLVRVRLHTGRKHQIRVQLAGLGHPVVGDRKYGSRTRFPRGIALHSHRLEVDHPVQQQRQRFTAPLPQAWRDFGVRLRA